MGVYPSVYISLYRKSTHTDQYLHFDSNQQLQHKLRVIRTLKHRAHTISFDNETLDKELDHIQQSLSICGYTRQVWDSLARNKIIPKPRRPDYTAPVGSITLPYIQGVTEGLSRTIRKAGVQVHVKPANTVRSTLVAPKDKPKKCDRSCVIYGISCNNCASQYVGETERPLRKRLSEHKRPSPVGAHLNSEGHEFNTDNVKVLDSDSSWLQRASMKRIA
ncbi:uncharacterized protein [Amphiura filiformis]|uniref:uncharacterized protein n=1 Tax=Amphiura filiformis TaxID=82378 RepID=UPI003B2193AD